MFGTDVGEGVKTSVNYWMNYSFLEKKVFHISSWSQVNSMHFVQRSFNFSPLQRIGFIHDLKIVVHLRDGSIIGAKFLQIFVELVQ